MKIATNAQNASKKEIAILIKLKKGK